jgi:RNAse (barnase) inhibitor barstar
MGKSKNVQTFYENLKQYLEALGRVWVDLDHVWQLEPKTTPLPFELLYRLRKP